MKDLIDVVLPSEQSEGTRSQVSRWLKSVGDRVIENEPLLEVETDKVNVEIAAPCTGTLHEILKPLEQEIEPGAVLARINRAMTASPAPPESEAPAFTGPARATRTLTSNRTASDDLSPAVRRLLQEHGLDSAEVSATSENGRLSVADVLRHVSDSAGIPVPETVPADAPRSVARNAAVTRRVPHSVMRRRIAEHMVNSLLHTAPHVTTVFEVDLSAVLAHRALHRAAADLHGAPLTLTAYFLIACSEALKQVPEVNSRWAPDALELNESNHIGIGTALPDGGLVVPVIRDVGTLDLFGVARALADIVTRARQDRLVPADMRGGTFTISNHGVSGSLLATPIVINQPESAILGIGKLEKRSVVIQQEGHDVIAIRPRCYVTLTIDHRVLDGARANQFLTAVVKRLENWIE